MYQQKKREDTDTTSDVPHILAKTEIKTKSRKTLGKVKQASGKTARASKAVMKPLAVAAAQVAGRLDKLELVLPRAVFDGHEFEQTEARLRRSKLIKRITAKGSNYRVNYALNCPSGTAVTFHLLPTKRDMKYGLKIVLNPDHMKPEDVEAFGECLKRMFPLDYKSMVSSLLLIRIDQAFDHEVRMADVIIQLRGSPTESKYFVRTDRGGEVQAWYCARRDSPVSWIAYDQVASDNYKTTVGEIPSHAPHREKFEEIADFLADRIGDHSRFEMRRRYRTALTLRQADDEAKRKPMGIVDIYLVTSDKLAEAPPGFGTYLDSVRLRGVTGAASSFLSIERGRDKAERLAVFEAYLAECAAPFWDKAGLDCSIRTALFGLPIWRILKHLA